MEGSKGEKHEIKGGGRRDVGGRVMCCATDVCTSKFCSPQLFYALCSECRSNWWRALGRGNALYGALFAGANPSLLPNPVPSSPPSLPPLRRSSLVGIAGSGLTSPSPSLRTCDPCLPNMNLVRSPLCVRPSCTAALPI